MKNLDCDKMLLAVLQGEDYQEAIAELNRHGFYATVLNSSGGFLKKKSVTVMIGLNHAYLEEAIGLLKRYGERMETHYQPAGMSGAGTVSMAGATIPVPVRCGGVVLFVLDVERNERY